jgi:hypothetical protein
MKWLRTCLAFGCVSVIAVVLSAAAQADPSNAASAVTGTAMCSNQQTYPFVANQGQSMNARFAPAFIVGSNSVFVPTLLDLTISVGGTPVATVNFVKPANLNGQDILACTVSGTGPGGSTFTGTVQGFLTPG